MLLALQAPASAEVVPELSEVQKKQARFTFLEKKGDAKELFLAFVDCPVSYKHRKRGFVTQLSLCKTFLPPVHENPFHLHLYADHSVQLLALLQTSIGLDELASSGK